MEPVEPIKPHEQITTHEPPAKITDQSKKKRKIFFGLMTTFFLLIAIGYLIYWLIWAQFEEFTDDAYVNGNMVTLTPLVSGIVTTIYVQNTDFVTKDTPLVQLDTTDYVIALETSKQALADTVRSVAQLFAKAGELEAQIEVQKAEFIKTAQDFEHRENLVESGGVSIEDFEHAMAALSSAYYTLVAIEQQLMGVLAQIENTSIETHPQVEKAKEKVKEAWIKLKRCTLSAPVTGLVAQRSVQVGEWVKPAQPLLAVVPFDQMWVDANYKEVQLKKMRIGQPVKLKSDMYGGSVIYHGKISGIGGGTGSVFSVLPPQNATGNWIKIVQRLPVRIDIPPEELIKHPLRLGLSIEATVDLHDLPGTELIPPPRAVDVPRFATDIYAKEEEGVDKIIQEIMDANVTAYAPALENDAPSEEESP